MDVRPGTIAGAAALAITLACGGTDPVPGEATSDAATDPAGADAMPDPSPPGPESGPEVAEVADTATGEPSPFPDPGGQACAVATKVTSWGAVGVVVTLSTPADTAEVQATCPDFSGDGKGDNGLRIVAGTVNPEFAKWIAAGESALLMEFQGVSDFADTPSFTLAGLWARPDPADDGPPTQDWRVERDSYDALTCNPLLSFADTRIAGGDLAAPPRTVSTTFAVPDLGGSLTLTFEQARVVMRVEDGAVTATSGVLAGILTKGQVDAAVERVRQQCKQPNPPDFCLVMDPMFAPRTPYYDLDLDGDGKKDAMSLCFLFTLRGGTVTGWADSALL